MSTRMEFDVSSEPPSETFTFGEMEAGDVFEIKDRFFWIKTIDGFAVGLVTGCVVNFRDDVEVNPHRCTVSARRVYSREEFESR